MLRLEPGLYELKPARLSRCNPWEWSRPGKWGLAPAQEGDSPRSGQSPPVPVPIFLAASVGLEWAEGRR